MFLHFLYFTCCARPFLFGLHFLQRGLMFHYILSFCSNMVNFENMFQHIRQKLKKHSHFIISSCDEVFTRLFSFFHPGMKFHPCLSSRDEILSRQKLVNSKKHFTIGRDNFILGRVSSRDEISRGNTFLEII